MLHKVNLSVNENSGNLYRYMSLILSEMLDIRSTKIHLMFNSSKKSLIFCIY